MIRIWYYSICTLLWLMLIFSCSSEKKNSSAPVKFQYKEFKDSVLNKDTGKTADISNIFDTKIFVPGKDTLETMLIRIDTLWRREEVMMAQLDTMRTHLKRNAGFSDEEKKIINENIKMVESYLLARDSIPVSSCSGKECMLFVEINKATQTLYVYLLGELKDSFKVSTGKGKEYETPNLELRPQGPILTKYTSRKFPGGNYQGLGNMPYAVFLRSGYAIHGTTPGNYAKLGSKASHGCIRLHPDNAKVFNALVKTIGLSQTWVSIKDSLP